LTEDANVEDQWAGRAESICGNRADSRGVSQIDPKRSLMARNGNGEKCPTPAVRKRLSWVENSIFAEKTPPVIFIGGKIRPDPDEIRKADSIRNQVG